MDTLVITPKIVDNQYWFTLPDDLEEQDIEFKLIIHYKPKEKKEPKKEFWFPDFDRISLIGETFSREEMYDDWGR